MFGHQTCHIVDASVSVRSPDMSYCGCLCKCSVTRHVMLWMSLSVRSPDMSCCGCLCNVWFLRYVMLLKPQEVCHLFHCIVTIIYHWQTRGGRFRGSNTSRTPSSKIYIMVYGKALDYKSLGRGFASELVLGRLSLYIIHATGTGLPPLVLTDVYIGDLKHNLYISNTHVSTDAPSCY